MRPEIIGTVEDLDAAVLPVNLDLLAHHEAAMTESIRREAGKEGHPMLVTMIEVRSIIRALRSRMEREGEADATS